MCVVLCQPFSLLLPTGRLFCPYKKNKTKSNTTNKANLHIGATDGRQGESESPIKILL